jgi:hypothetical protein
MGKLPLLAFVCPKNAAMIISALVDLVGVIDTLIPLTST